MRLETKRALKTFVAGLASLGVMGAALGFWATSCKPRSARSSVKSSSAAYLGACGIPTKVFVDKTQANAGVDRSREQILALDGGGDDLGARAQSVFAAKCAKCHGPNATQSTSVGDLTKWGDAQAKAERIVELIVSKDGQPPQMPPLPPSGLTEEELRKIKLTKEEIEIIQSWAKTRPKFPGTSAITEFRSDHIASVEDDDDYNTTANFISVRDQIECVKRDYMRLPEAMKPNVRYISFTHLYNAGLLSERQFAREALFKTINSLSVNNRNLHPPYVIDGTFETLYRVHINAYDWDVGPQAEALKEITNRNAQLYGGIYDSFLDKNEAQLRPIRGDWFIRESLREPFYYKFINVVSLNDFVSRFQWVNPSFNGKTRRAVIVERGPDVRSVSGVDGGRARVVDRWTSSTNLYGVYDFKERVGQKDPILFPFGPVGFNNLPNDKIFIYDNAAYMATLPNGMYAFANFVGDKLSGSNEVFVGDGKNRGLKNFAASSCMGCHVKGPFQVKDAIASKIKKYPDGQITVNGRVAPVGAEVMFPGDAFNDYVKKDQEYYMKALVEIGIKDFSYEPTEAIIEIYDRDVNAKMAAAEFGMPIDSMRKTIEADPNLRQILGDLLRDDGSVHRKAFEAAFTRAFVTSNSISRTLNPTNPANGLRCRGTSGQVDWTVTEEADGRDLTARKMSEAECLSAINTASASEVCVKKVGGFEFKNRKTGQFTGTSCSL